MSSPHRSRRAVGIWLLVLAGMVIVQVALGGITRLTDSGLSITEWRPLLGVVPPLDDAGWQEAFAKYREIPQYRLLKSSLTLEEFKFIYFWEWFHRLFGRLLGVAFVVPFVVFHWRKRLVGFYRPLAGLAALGAGQGLMGWLMVASGLTERVYVSHLRLAAHFMFAAVLFIALVHMGVRLVRDPAPLAREGALTKRRVADALLALLLLQLVYGAFMAGLKAAVFAPTWPTINGVWVPTGIASFDAVINNPIGVHFVHRTLAYLLVAGVLGLAIGAHRSLGLEGRLLGALVVLQATLGVLTAIKSYQHGWLLPLGVTHQVVALLLLAALLVARMRLAAACRSPEQATTASPDAAPAPA
ncbi:MAG: COX15/CtaA family protein [Polyangiaceae bacterium]